MPCPCNKKKIEPYRNYGRSYDDYRFGNYYRGGYDPIVIQRQPVIIQTPTPMPIQTQTPTPTLFSNFVDGPIVKDPTFISSFCCLLMLMIIIGFMMLNKKSI